MDPLDPWAKVSWHVSKWKSAGYMSDGKCEYQFVMAQGHYKDRCRSDRSHLSTHSSPLSQPNRPLHSKVTCKVISIDQWATEKNWLQILKWRGQQFWSMQEKCSLHMHKRFFRWLKLQKYGFSTQKLVFPKE